MDPKIWKNLPTELIRKIILESNPSIDTQLYFKIKPKKINEARAWRLWYLLKSHDGIIYNLESKSLHIFRVSGCHIVRRPIELDYVDNWMTVFNSREENHNLEITTSSGAHLTCPNHHESFYTEMRVLLRGSGMAPMITPSGVC